MKLDFASMYCAEFAFPTLQSLLYYIRFNVISFILGSGAKCRREGRYVPLAYLTATTHALQ